jgi:hypothetical protein
MKLKKYEFHKQSVKFLDYIITINKIQMNSSKVKTVLN